MDKLSRGARAGGIAGLLEIEPRGLVRFLRGDVLTPRPAPLLVYLALLIGCGGDRRRARSGGAVGDRAPALACLEQAPPSAGCSNGQVPEDSIEDTELPLALLAAPCGRPAAARRPSATIERG